MTFEDRLRRTVVVVLATMGTACPPGATTPTDLEGLCAGDAPPEDYLVATGWVEIEPGGVCPDAADADIQVYGCTWLEWQDITCGFDHVDTDQVFVNDGYGGFHANQTTVPTGYTTGPVVDVCVYDAVFYLPPDHPTCGRPLLQDGQPVIASVRGGASRWADRARPDAEGLSEGERARLAEYWLGSALLEHASVASFSHAALALLQLGAPPELVAGAHQAALDEVVHARLCFSLASGYRDVPVGPGPLGALPAAASSREAFAEALVREGCVAETLAAVDAAARLAGATDAAVRAALEVIVRDESAHAALAWRTLAWLLATDDGGLRAHLAGVLAEERERWLAAAGDGAEISAAARAHGLLADAERRAALARAWDEVITASWGALA